MACRCSVVSSLMGYGDMAIVPCSQKLWSVPVLLAPQQKKLVHHGRVDFWCSGENDRVMRAGML
jgi:hypothetical protein